MGSADPCRSPTPRLRIRAPKTNAALANVVLLVITYHRPFSGGEVRTQGMSHNVSLRRNSVITATYDKAKSFFWAIFCKLFSHYFSTASRPFNIHCKNVLLFQSFFSPLWLNEKC